MLEALSVGLAQLLASPEFLAWKDATLALTGVAGKILVMTIITYLLGKAFADARVQAVAKPAWGWVEQMGLLGQLKGKGAAKLAAAIERLREQTDFAHKLLFWLFGWWNEARLASLFDSITGEVNGALGRGSDEVARSGPLPGASAVDTN